MAASSSLDLPTKILHARHRIKSFIRRTPLEYSSGLSKMADGCDVYIKLGVTLTFIPLKVHCQKNVDTDKRKSLEHQGATAVLFGKEYLDAEVEARRVANQTDVEYMSSYNDYDIIAGQGTISVEILKQLSEVDAILVSVGGGGSISGIARYTKQMKPSVKIIGCSPEKSKVMHESMKAKKLIFEESFDTLSDGTAGAIEENAVTFELCRHYVNEWILVTEEQIGKAIVFMVQNHHKTRQDI